MSEYIRPEGGKVLDEHDKCPYCGADLMEYGAFMANYGECGKCERKWSEIPGRSTSDMAFDHCPKCNSKNVYASCGSRMHCKDCNTTWYPGDEDQAKTLGGDGSSVSSGGGGGCGGGGGGGCCGGMSQSAANNDGTSNSKPTAADYANIATKMSDAADSLPSALDNDAMKGLTEPAAADVAKECIKKACEGASDYLKKNKPEIIEDLKKFSKKSGGACGGKQQEENKKKGGCCGSTASSACSAACAAAPGFQPSEALTMQALLMAAKEVCEKDLAAVLATMGTIPSIVTMPEGTPAAPTIAQCLAIATELEACLTSLRLTQEALLSKIGVGL